MQVPFIFRDKGSIIASLIIYTIWRKVKLFNELAILFIIHFLPIFARYKSVNRNKMISFDKKEKDLNFSGPEFFFAESWQNYTDNVSDYTFILQIRLKMGNKIKCNNAEMEFLSRQEIRRNTFFFFFFWEIKERKEEKICKSVLRVIRGEVKVETARELDVYSFNNADPLATILLAKNENQKRIKSNEQLRTPIERSTLNILFARIVGGTWTFFRYQTAAFGNSIEKKPEAHPHMDFECLSRNIL